MFLSSYVSWAERSFADSVAVSLTPQCKVSSDGAGVLCHLLINIENTSDGCNFFKCVQQHTQFKIQNHTW